MWESTPAWRQRVLDAESAAENARARRMGALAEALYAVRHEDDDVLTEDQRGVLSMAQGVADELHAIW